MPGKSNRTRVLSYGSSTLISSLVFLGILVFVVLIVERHPWRLDLTEAGTYTLSDQTRKILKSLDKPVTIKAFFATAAPEQTKAKDLLDTYRYFDNKLNYEFIDPDREPEVAKRYEIRSYGTLVLEGYGKRQTVQTADEENITNALLKLTRQDEKKIYFTIGHGEHSVGSTERDGYSEVQSSLQREGYVVSQLNLLQQAEVPADAAAVVLAGPKKSLLSNEIETLKAYVSNGGKLIVMLDPFQDAGLQDFLKSYGIQADNDVIVDKLSRVFGGSYLMPVVTEYGTSKITQDFAIATFFPEARSMRSLEDAPDNVQVEVIASSSPQSWGEFDLEVLSQGQAGLDEGKDLPGPVTLAVMAEVSAKEASESGSQAAEDEKSAEKSEPEKPAGQDEGGEKPASTKTGYLLAIGDSDFADNTHFGLSGNGDLFLNMVSFMAEEENLITIESREKGGRPLLMTQDQAQMVFMTVLVFVPLCILIAGLSVYRVRRSQR